MSDYPERISISPVHRQKHDDDFYLVDRKAFPGKGTEYVRADRIEELEGRLAKAEVIVRIIASDKWEERLGEAVDLSCEYLAELMGDEDDD